MYNQYRYLSGSSNYSLFDNIYSANDDIQYYLAYPNVIAHDLGIVPSYFGWNST